MSDDIRDLFGGPDSPDEMAQMPADDELPKEGDEFEDGFAADPRSADLDDFAEPFEGILRDKVETYNEEFEDGDEKNDRVTEDMIAAVAHRARGAYTDTHDGRAGSVDWMFARANEFLERAANLDENAGFEVDPEYTQDDDLLPRGLEESTLEDDEVNPDNGPDLR
jgi:hypothetical protein